MQYFHVALPERLALEGFMHSLCRNVNSETLVKVFDCQLELFNVFFLIYHNVQPVPQRPCALLDSGRLGWSATQSVVRFD